MSFDELLLFKFWFTLDSKLPKITFLYIYTKKTKTHWVPKHALPFSVNSYDFDPGPIGA